ncbi:MAG: cupin domain-containing protein [Campylobacteraceae bacterium]
MNIKMLKSISLVLIVGVTALNAQSSQVIHKAGSQGSFNGSSEYFTGNVHVNMLFPPNNVTSFSSGYVTFEPNARSAWHTHPAGQHLVVVSGVGKTGVWGKEVQEIKAGDVVWCPPGVKHWHGASNNESMTHMAITTNLDGKTVTWMEKVTDEEYNKKVGEVK